MFTDLVNRGSTREFARCVRGAVSPLVALMLIPILGATALAVDTGYWYFKQRDMQSAADTAAIAAAQTPDEDEAYDGTNDDYIKVARGTAAEYGYVHGDGSVTVDVSRVTCPSGEEGCTQVIIGYTSPLFFSPIVGFSGNQNGGQGVSALAVAGDQAGAIPNEFCVLSLDTTIGVDGIKANGSPKANLAGCDIFSNNNMLCHGLGLKADHALSVGSGNTGCALDPANNLPKQDPVPDPYADLAKNIPAKSCPANPPVNEINTNPSWSGLTQICGDVLLKNNVTVNNTTLMIYNGRLIANGKTFTATDSTVIFTGENNASYHHFPTDAADSTKNVNKSFFNISAPTTGDWKGVAIYQDPKLTTNVDIQESGNEPTFNVSGLFYAPHSNMVIKGIVDKDGSGYNCFVLVTNTLLLDGTGQLFASTEECDLQGLEPPGSGATVKKWLVK